jgi:peroxiredoxin Q/BCP
LTQKNFRANCTTTKTLGLLPGRVTYVIDQQGVIRHKFASQLAADRHVSEALGVVRKLAVDK